MYGRKRIIHAIGRDLQNELMFHIQHDVAALTIVADEVVQGVAVGHPADEARSGAERHHCVALDGEVLSCQRIVAVI